jgi:hypothetical protein
MMLADNANSSTNGIGGGDDDDDDYGLGDSANKRPKMSGDNHNQQKENFSACAPNGVRGYHSNHLANRMFGGQQHGAGGQGAAKKLVIKNLKAKPALPDNFEERSLQKLRKAVVAIQKAERIDTR